MGTEAFLLPSLWSSEKNFRLIIQCRTEELYPNCSNSRLFVSHQQQVHQKPTTETDQEQERSVGRPLHFKKSTLKKQEWCQKRWKLLI